MKTLSKYCTMRDKYVSREFDKSRDTSYKPNKRALKDFVKERDRILNLDNFEEFLNYSKKRNIKIPDDKEVCLIAYHKCRFNSLGVYPKLKKASKKWLIENGYSTKIK